MTEPRILFYDIETSPIIGYTWGVWQTDVIDILEDYQILSVAWKWLGDKKVQVVGQDDFDNYVPGVNNDIEVVKKIRELFDEADMVIAHNGNSFDQKKSQARMMIHGLMPPSPYKQLDTKLIAKRHGNFTRNNLKWLAKDLGVNQKGDAGGFDTWKGCLAGDKKAWKHMKLYNKQDIPPLEDLYLHFRPWMSGHPNMAVISQRPDSCPKCGGNSLQSRGTVPTQAGLKRIFSCNSCGSSVRLRVQEKDDGQVKPTYVNL